MDRQSKLEPSRNLDVRPHKRVPLKNLKPAARPKTPKFDAEANDQTENCRNWAAENGTESTISVYADAAASAESQNARDDVVSGDGNNAPSSDDDAVIRSGADRYKILEHLGSGTFGNVAKCWKMGTNDIVALKIMIRTTSENEEPSEVRALARIHEDPSNGFYFVRAHDWFVHKKQTCIVFEALATNLHTFVQENEHRPLPLKCVRAILRQLLGALSRLKRLGIVHSDLKPVNVMLVDPIDRPCRVKIIDFGSAFHVRSIRQNVLVQSRYYRSPEVLLGLPFSEAIDMWSLGCVAAELYLAAPLFPGYTEHDQVLHICRTLGTFASHVLDGGAKTPRFFSRGPTSQNVWELKETDRHRESPAGMAFGTLRRPPLQKLDDILHRYPLTNCVDRTTLLAEKYDRIEFLDLLRRMLCKYERQRIAPDEALLHPFVRLTHLIPYAGCDVVRDSVHLLRTCRNNVPATNAEIEGRGSQAKPQSRA